VVGVNDPIALDFGEIGTTHDGLTIDCPGCGDFIYLYTYLKWGCRQFDDPARPVLLLPKEWSE